MSEFIIIGVLLIFSIMKFYKSRALFKQLSKREWLQYIVGFICAWIVAVTIILGSSKLTDGIQMGWFDNVLAILFILIGLVCAEFIVHKTLPEKIREFYS